MNTFTLTALINISEITPWENDNVPLGRSLLGRELPPGIVQGYPQRLKLLRRLHSEFTRSVFLYSLFLVNVNFSSLLDHLNTIFTAKDLINIGIVLFFWVSGRLHSIIFSGQPCTFAAGLLIFLFSNVKGVPINIETEWQRQNRLFKEFILHCFTKFKKSCNFLMCLWHFSENKYAIKTKYLRFCWQLMMTWMRNLETRFQSSKYFFILFNFMYSGTHKSVD